MKLRVLVALPQKQLFTHYQKSNYRPVKQTKILFVGFCTRQVFCVSMDLDLEQTHLKGISALYS